MTLEFTINNQTLRYLTTGKLVADSERYLKAHFKFSSDWDGLDRIVYFKRKYDDQHDYYFDYTLDSTNTVIIPWEVLQQEGTIRVGCYGQTVNNGGVNETVITCNYVEVYLSASCLVPGQIPSTPSQGIIGQTYAKIATVYDNLAYITPVGQNITAVTGVYNNLTAINAVNTNSTNINTVATNIVNVNAVGTNIAAVTNVNSNMSAITTVNANATNINTVATNISDVGSVADNIANVNAVADNETNINAANANKTNINSVAGNIAAITGVYNNTSNINAVNANASNINTVAGMSSNIAAIVDDKANIDAVAGDLDNIDAASGHAATASAKATEAANSASAAALSATSANTSATTATQKATAASNSATSASTSASNASTSATSAETSATSASRYATTATTKAAEASASATNAATSATNAATSETNAATSESNASDSATSAAASATDASGYATSASNSATAAGNSATSAGTSATNASVSETNAATSALSASDSATTATTKAGEASDSATTATTQAGIATAKASEASTDAALSKQYAIGEPTEPAEGSAKYWAGQASQGQIQSDLAQTDNTKKDFIKNKQLQYLDDDATHRLVTDTEKATWNGKQSPATTLTGYGITDAKITGGTITLGSNTITPLTTHQDISGKADKATTYTKTEVDTTISGITAKIPSQASSSNQLADKDFVNSSIATNTANYISNAGQPFNSFAELEAYTGTVTHNDYAFVTGTDSAGNTYFDRYKASVSGSTVTWAKEYRLNNSSFTATQWAAITSGITATLVASYNSHIADTTIHVTSSDKNNWNGKATGSISGGVITINGDSITPLTQHQDISGKQNTITGGATTITSSNLTASRALVSDSSGKVAVSAVTSTELGYLDGVTSAIQTQIDNKATKTSITAGTAGTSSATSGSSLAVPYVTMNAQGIVTGYGTHTHTVTGFSTTDTKNTAGTTNTTSKIYLAGATSQAANPQTYSNSSCYASGGYLYSGGTKVLTAHQSIKTINGNSMVGSGDVTIQGGHTWTTTPASGGIGGASPTTPAVVVENYCNGTEWYRVWSDGFIEQGGINKSQTIPFLVAMSNSSYLLLFNPTLNTSDGGTWTNITKYTAYAVVQWSSNDGTSTQFEWYVCGY